MFKNIWLYIVVTALISAICSLAVYFNYFNPFNFSHPILLWVIRVIIYSLFAWWLFHLTDNKEVSIIGWLSLIIPFISILSNNTIRITADTLIENLLYQNINCFICFIVVTIWMLYILIAKSKTLLGFLVLLNIIVSIFIILPYGIPRLELLFQNGLTFKFYNFSLLPYHTLHNYRPFIHQDSGALSFLLDIRTLSSIVFFGYMLLISVFKSSKLKYEDHLEEDIRKTENSIVQFLIAGRYFLWNIIGRFIFFMKNFWTIFKRNLWEAIYSSIQSYMIALLLIFAFITPLLIFLLSNSIYEYSKSISMFSYNQVTIILIFTVLILFPLILIKLLKSQYTPFIIYNFMPSDRPSFFIPIYIILLALGIAAIATYFITNIFGLFLILFIVFAVYVITWGIRNSLRKSSIKL